MDAEVTKVVSEAIEGTLKYWILLAAAGNFCVVLVTGIVAYNKMKWRVDDAVSDINGIGAIVKEVKKTVTDNHIEDLRTTASTLVRVAHVEGLLEGLFKPRHKDGHA